MPTSATSATPATTANPVTDARFAALKKKLRELFELDKSDLDFGIYRIMAAKNTEVTDFLDRQLKEVVRETLAGHGVNAVAQVDAEIAEARQAAQAAGFNPDDSPTVQALMAKRDSAGGASSAELEADIYNHLLAFFSRYYDEGDFISKRRYKGDTYAIPYSGEEVVLHWANKDQYYIKSGEWHKDYRFKIGGRTARVRLLQATQEANNNKEADDAKRRFILCADNPVDAQNTTELILHFEFRTPTDEEKKAVSDSESTRIFGGKYDKASGRTKGDEREQFAAYAEKIALEAMPDEWKQLVGKLSDTPAKPKRTILGKHLDDFTARNTFDYFIHKDLGGFLSRELDFYIKNEVVRLDDLEALDDGHLARVQGKIKAIRRVAGRIIEFLAALENFQKKLWLKKKLVLNTNWLVTVDRVPEKQRDTVAACQEQWTEWEALGFKPVLPLPAGEGRGEGVPASLFGGADWGTRDYLDACDKLVVDTRFFDADFKADLLASDEVLGGEETLDEAMTGVLINGENYQSLRLICDTNADAFDVVFIDPPYNTGIDGFPYKDAYQHSSWMAMINDRVRAVWPAMPSDGLFFATIDFVEVSRLRTILDAIAGDDCFLADIAWEKRYTRSNNAKRFYSLKDTVLAYRASTALDIVRERRSEKSKQNYTNPDSDLRGSWISSSYVNPATREARPNLVYPINNPTTGANVEHPTHAWKYDPETHKQHVDDNRLYWGVDGGYEYPRLKSFLSDAAEGMVPIDVWHHKDTGTTDDGGNVVKALFGEAVFDNPKPPSLMQRAMALSPRSGTGLTMLDYFAGSGSSGHAVLNQTREDGVAHRMCLIEQGAYFYTVLKPRIAKVIYSPDWKGGKAQIHDKGLSALVKYFAVESYEDALNNLPAPGGDLLADADDATRDALITYALDLELGPHLLNLDALGDPWGYTINAQPAGDDEIRPHLVDLVETFNYLLGLKVHAYGPIERYSAKFERAAHDDNLGRLKVVAEPGTRYGLRKDADGPFVFQRVEGVLNDGDNTRVLVVWRKLTDEPEQDAAALDAWMARHREDTKQRSEQRDYHQIYINGPVTLPQPTQEIRTVFPIEQAFKDRMFADTEGSV